MAHIIASRFTSTQRKDFYSPFEQDKGAGFEVTKRQVFDARHELVGTMATAALAKWVAEQLTADAERDAQGGGITSCDHYDSECEQELYVNPQGQCVLCSTVRKD